MIEARASSVPEISGWTAVSGKGETAEGCSAGPGRMFWDTAEDAVYCHEMWSAIWQSELTNEFI